jgi:hypothetical protein
MNNQDHFKEGYSGKRYINRVMLALIGFVYTIYLFSIWVGSGFRLPIRGQNVISVTL